VYGRDMLNRCGFVMGNRSVASRETEREATACSPEAVHLQGAAEGSRDAG
jgi:hypothetical protein